MKHTISIYLIFSILMILLTECKKIGPYDGEYEISGKVLDELTGKPIPHALVGVLETSREDFSGWGAKTVISGYADENGSFSYRFKADENKNYYELVAKENQKYFEKSSFPRITFNSKGKSTMNVTLMPYGYLTLHIKGNKGGAFMSIEYSQFRRGVDTSITFHKEPNKETLFYYSVYDGMGTSTIYGNLIYKDTLNINTPSPPDTAFYLIEF